MLALSVLALVGLQDPAPPLPKLSTKDLERGATVGVDAQGTPLESVIAGLESECEFGWQAPIGPGPDGQTWWHELPVELSVRRASAWELADQLAASLGLHCAGIQFQSIQLAEAAEVFHHGPFAAPAQNAGAFRLQPVWRDEDARELRLLLFAEPRVMPPAIQSFDVRLSWEGGEQRYTSAEPAGAELAADGDSPYLVLPLGEAGIEAEALTLAVDLQTEVVTEWRATGLDTLGEMLEQPWEDDGVVVEVRRLLSPADQPDAFEPGMAVEFAVRGARTPVRRAALAERRNSRLSPKGWSETLDEGQLLTLDFDPAVLRQELSEYELVLDLPKRRVEWPLAFAFEELALP